MTPSGVLVHDDGKDAKLIDYLVRNHHTSPLGVRAVHLRSEGPDLCVPAVAPPPDVEFSMRCRPGTRCCPRNTTFPR
jgi:hypothetical protein